MFSTEELRAQIDSVWKRHTGVLEGKPSSEAALRYAHGSEDAGKDPTMRYCSRGDCRKNLSSRPSNRSLR